MAADNVACHRHNVVAKVGFAHDVRCCVVLVDCVLHSRVIAVDLTAGLNRDRLQLSQPAVCNGQLESEIIANALLPGETHSAVERLHRFMQHLMVDPEQPDIEWLAAMELILADGSVILQTAHHAFAREMLPRSYGGTKRVPRCTICNFHLLALNMKALHSSTATAGCWSRTTALPLHECV